MTAALIRSQQADDKANRLKGKSAHLSDCCDMLPLARSNRRQEAASTRTRTIGTIAPTKRTLSIVSGCAYLFLLVLQSTTCNKNVVLAEQQLARAASPASKLPDLVSGTSDEPIVAVIGQDAFISCVAKNLQNYTIVWRYTNRANAPGELSAAEGGEQQEAGAADQQQQLATTILTAGRQRVTQDARFTVIQSHDTWLLKITNVRLSDTGTYICQTNSEPRVRALRILSVIKPSRSQTDAAGKCL